MIRLFFFLFLSVNFSAQTVYKTPSGSKYHLSGCRMVKNVSTSLSVDNALNQGLMPCKFCRPPFKAVLGISSKPKQIAGINSKNQCYAKTQKGIRCKRNTRIGNDFCFQHLPK